VLSRCNGRTKGGLNSKLHVVCDGAGKPLVMLLTEGQVSDHKGARLMLKALPATKAMIADRGYDSDWFRQALAARGTAPCIPPTKSRKKPLDYDKALYRQRRKIENLFAKLKDWRRIATRYDRCAHAFFSAIRIAAAVAFYLKQGVLNLEVADAIEELQAWVDGLEFERDEAIAAVAAEREACARITETYSDEIDGFDGRMARKQPVALVGFRGIDEACGGAGVFPCDGGRAFIVDGKSVAGFATRLAAGDGAVLAIGIGEPRDNFLASVVTDIRREAAGGAQRFRQSAFATRADAALINARAANAGDILGAARASPVRIVSRAALDFDPACVDIDRARSPAQHICRDAVFRKRLAREAYRLIGRLERGSPAFPFARGGRRFAKRPAHVQRLRKARPE
jgi:transposase